MIGQFWFCIQHPELKLWDKNKTREYHRIPVSDILFVLCRPVYVYSHVKIYNFVSSYEHREEWEKVHL